MISNNALYFADNSDYETALYEILKIVSPEVWNENDELTSDIKFIDEDKEKILLFSTPLTKSSIFYDKWLEFKKENK
jgi:hypothetical protein